MKRSTNPLAFYRTVAIAIVAVVLLLAALGRIVALATDYLWFDSLGYASVFMREFWAKAWLGLGAFAVTAVWLGGHTALAARLSPGTGFHIRGLPVVLTPRQLKRLTAVAVGGFSLLVAYVVGVRAAGAWYAILQFLHQADFQWTDPVLGLDAAFYVFTVPVLELLQGYVLWMAALGIIVVAAAHFIGGAIGWPYAKMTRAATLHLAGLAAVGLVAWGFGYWLQRYALLLSPDGAVFGAGYVDVHVRMPALAILAVASIGAAAMVVAAAVRMRLKWAYMAGAVLAGAHVIALWSVPAFQQRFEVEPNELERERPFLANAIAGTRFAYSLDGVQVVPYMATGRLSLEEVVQVTGTIDNVRVWDWRVLRDTYNQIEALRPYYRFHDVDVGRYNVGGHYRQVAMAVRELETGLLNPDSRTWVNLHLLYTHGFGLCMSPVNAVTPEGLPEMWIRNIPPQTRPDLPVARPEIYFGELTRDYVFVRTTQKEFDYPLGDENRYTAYEGKDGVPVGSLARRLLFAWAMDDWNIVLTQSFTDETRILWRRAVADRVRHLAPFLELDGDPYPVLHEGRIVWILDAYTTTTRFPYADRVRLPRGNVAPNYIRNSVKAVVDAYDGTVVFYVTDSGDPLVLAAQSVFPGMFRDVAQMPPSLRAHLRYPLDLFEIQAQQFLAYHMTDPQIFYNKEDLWQRPAATFRGRLQPIEAYYFIMNLPAEERPEYILMLPFTPATKDNMVAWMAARSDGAQYGKLIVYTFPKDRLIFGPNQVEARINQNDQISPLLTLWDQQGSKVVRGNILVIPVGDSILYVQPLYLQSENAAIPELKRVIVSYHERIAMRPTLVDAMAVAFGDQPEGPGPADFLTPGTVLPPTPQTEKALELFQKAQDQMRKSDWAGYGATIKELEGVLRGMAEPAPAPEKPAPGKAP